MKNILALLIAFVALSLVNSCSYDNEEHLYGIQICDTLSMSFESDIAPIINEHCTSCHGGETPSAGLSLMNYNELIVSANDDTNSGIINRIQRTEGEVGAMPTTYRLSHCQIEYIKAWVNQGALNN